MCRNVILDKNRMRLTLPCCISVPVLKEDSLLIAQAAFGTKILTVTVTITLFMTEIIHVRMFGVHIMFEDV